MDQPVAQADSPASERLAPAPGRLEVEGGLAWLVLDDPAKRVNTLGRRSLAWFEEVLGGLLAAPPRGLVIVSGKPDGFVAGADIEELAGLADPEAVAALLERGHALLARLAAAPFPTVAAIHGACLGAGLELALACKARVATEHPKTRLGLPEVQLGLIPGLGGTQRLPRLVGVAAALDLVASGRALDAKRARRLGLVDDTCHPADLRRAALRRLQAEAGPRGGTAAAGRRDPQGGTGSPGRPGPGGRRMPRGLAARVTDLASRLPVVSGLVFGRARREVLARTGGHYPAPLAAVEVIRRGIRLPLRRALEIEAEAFARLAVSPEAKNLMGLFFAKNDVEARAATLARGAPQAPRVGVLGAGFMGAGIAQALAREGLPVVVKDRDLPALARGMKQAGGLFSELVGKRRLSPVEARSGLARLRPTVDPAAFAGVDFAIEAVFEDLAVKQAVLAEVEAVAPEGLVFASNTSTIPIAEIARASRRPERVVGMHFFSPVHKMPLLEVIRHPGTSTEALATTVELGRRLGKTVIVVGDGPGFFTSRVLGPLLNEGAWCLAQGATVEEVDRALTAWGWPVGPLTLLDEVGLDIAHHAGEVVRGRLGGRVAAPPGLAAMVGDGRLGRKAGRGFYLYGGGRKRVDPEVYSLLGWQRGGLPAEEIADRCWLAMLNETARAMEDGVIANPVDVDIGAIFGLGFPPFRGGLLREADREGLPAVVERLSAYAARYGERLAPAPLLVEMAAAGERFHARRPG